MARRTKKMKTEIQLPLLDNRAKGHTDMGAATSETTNLDALLASVLRVFAARGRALREAREKQKGDESETRIAEN